MTKFFLAYGFNPQGQVLAQRIATLLNNLGVETVDGKSITGELNSQIQEKIKACDALISILIEGQDNSYTESETNFAFGCGKPIIIAAQGNVLRKGLFSGHPHIQLSNEGFEVASELVAAVNNINLKKPLTKNDANEAFDEFVAIGMERIHDDLTDDKLKERLAGSKEIKVLKTWFPESVRIAIGLEKAIKQGATVQLLLCKPGSDILKQRSHGAGMPEWWGSVLVYTSVYRIHRCLLAKSNPRVQIAIYHGWPGSPVIWCDKKILMGFYFRGDSSPAWPWVNVREGSYLAGILEDQFNELWNDENTKYLDTIEKMEDWLEENKKWERLDVIPEHSTE